MTKRATSRRAARKNILFSFIFLFCAYVPFGPLIDLAATVRDSCVASGGLFPGRASALDHSRILHSEDSLELADEYQKRGVLSPNFYDDGLHIGLATVAQADLLVSWNFKHIVHFDKIRLFNAVNIEFGYKPLQIFSPREVTTYGREED